MHADRVSTLAGGANQQGVRDHNERLIMSLLLRHGALPGSELSRLAGVSPQTVSVILRGLERDGYITRGTPIRGKVGKPSIPMTLAADGAYSLGLKIGRCSADVVLMDLHGKVHSTAQLTYDYPEMSQIVGFLAQSLETIANEMSKEAIARLTGIGVAMPFQIWNWHNSLGTPRSVFDEWETTDLEGKIRAITDLPIHIVNDATAACQAEHIFGRGKVFSDYAYFFVGAFVGGGVVMSNALVEGPGGNAGAFGSLRSNQPDGTSKQLIDTASIFLLEAQLSAAGLDPRMLWSNQPTWTGFDEYLTPWIEQTALELAKAALSVCSVIDFKAVVIDGGFPESVRAALVEKTRMRLVELDARGLRLPRIEEGSIGPNARAIGAAGASLFDKCFLKNS
jgi:predicted NBD/HSP70 family sugar kinase